MDYDYFLSVYTSLQLNKTTLYNFHINGYMNPKIYDGYLTDMSIINKPERINKYVL